MRVIDTFRTVLSLAYSPSGRFLYSAGWRHVSRWDVGSGEEVPVYDERRDGYQQSVAVSPSGNRLGWVDVAPRRLRLTGADEHNRYDTQSLLCRPDLNQMGSWAFLHDDAPVQHAGSLAADPTGRSIAFVRSGTLHVGEVVRKLKVPTGRRVRDSGDVLGQPVRRVSTASPDLFGFASDRLLWWHEEGNLVLHDLETWTTQQTDHPEHLPRAVTPDGRNGVAASKREVLLLDLPSGRIRERYNWDVGTVEAVAVAPDGLTAAVAGWSGGIALFDLDG